MHDLEFGTVKGKPYHFPYDVRMQNTAVFGIKGTGKTENLLPMLANEQFENEREGSLFIVGKSRVSWLLYALAKRYHRDVLFLSPSCHAQMHEAVQLGISNIKDVSLNLVNFQEAMEQKKVVIIDAEPYKYHKRSMDVIIQILMNLQASIHVNTHETPFFTYIDEADVYLPYIKELLLYGEQFGVSSTLFMQSRSLIHARSPVLSAFVDSNVRTTILANALTYDDNTYFKERFYGKGEDDKLMMSRSREELLVETIEKGKRSVETTVVRFLSQKLFKDIEAEADKARETKVVSTPGYTIARSGEGESKQKKRTRSRKIKPESPVTGAELMPQPLKHSRVFISEADLFNEEMV